MDQLLADEGIADGETLWAMTDHQNSVRDVVDDNGTLRKHTQYDSFGRVTDEEYFDTAGDPVSAAHAEAIAQLFGYTGRPLDKYTGLQNNLNRWYDANTGRWLSEDPIGFAAGDANLYRYVGNAATMWVDPYGLAPTATWELAPAIPAAAEAAAAATPAVAAVGTGVLVGAAGYGGYKVGEAIDDAGLNPLTPLLTAPVEVYYWLFPNTGTRVRPLAASANEDEGHTKNARESTRTKHEQGDARRDQDRGGEKGDANRRPPRKRPPNWKGPWPPRAGAASTFSIGGESSALSHFPQEIKTLASLSPSQTELLLYF